MPLDDTVARLGGWPAALMSCVAFAFVDYLAIISVEAERPTPGGSRPSREMAGQGLGCIASGMGGSAPIGGSLTRSMLAGMIGHLALAHLHSLTIFYHILSYSIVVLSILAIPISSFIVAPRCLFPVARMRRSAFLTHCRGSWGLCAVSSPCATWEQFGRRYP